MFASVAPNFGLKTKRNMEGCLRRMCKNSVFFFFFFFFFGGGGRTLTSIVLNSCSSNSIHGPSSALFL